MVMLCTLIDDNNCTAHHFSIDNSFIDSRTLRIHRLVNVLFRQNNSICFPENIFKTFLKCFLHIRLALKKDSSTQPPRYLVFFKGRDADVMTAAFKEFSAKQLSQEKKPSIRKLLSSMKELAQKKDKVLDRTKHKDRGMEL